MTEPKSLIERLEERAAIYISQGYISSSPAVRDLLEAAARIKELESHIQIYIESEKIWVEKWKEWEAEISRLSGIIDNVKMRCEALSKLSIDDPKDFEAKKIKIVSDNILDIINKGEK